MTFNKVDYLKLQICHPYQSLVYIENHRLLQFPSKNKSLIPLETNNQPSLSHWIARVALFQAAEIRGQNTMPSVPYKIQHLLF